MTIEVGTVCGIAGCWEIGVVRSNLDRIRRMTEVLHHRGPDGGDHWVDERARIALGHRRLSIIDLSDAGKQPMKSSCGRFVITYNGEVYNAVPLRKELEKHNIQFIGYSDTEVIAEGLAHWGIEATIKRLIGMFAIGIWDRKLRELTLVRDRLGIKPLYWGFEKGLLLFGSELKALRAAPEFEPIINRLSVASFLRYNCVQAPMCIYENVQQLEPGSLIKVGQDGKVQSSKYWVIEDFIVSEGNGFISEDDNECVNALDEILTNAVKSRMISDVPLGAFLSGGIDSSTVLALMQKCSNVPAKSFSIGYENEQYNEAPHAKAVANHLGTHHTELYVTSEQTRDIIPNLPTIYDEPFADASQIPTYLVSSLAKQHVTVALSGDGGDELFAGYNRYVQAATMMKYFWKLPSSSRKFLSTILLSVPVERWNKIFRFSGLDKRVSLPGDKLHKLAGVLNGEQEDFYTRLVTHWPNAEKLAGVDELYENSLWERSKQLTSDPIAQMQYSDLLGYLPNDLLTKVDRASMAQSLEVRVPILDHRVVEFAWKLPLQMKIREGKGKWLLRQVLNRYVPQQLFDRPKMGFGIPIDSWLRGPLREWSEDLLSPQMIKKHSLLEAEPVQIKWREHLDGNRNWQYQIWDILMLQSWCEEWL